ncbi:hypothetical protein AAT19DRAFT_11743 [Rhodotorula toruloides]|uniref:Uncharacterized protein n=1 Tax=Rhodotorula toruloides TaxID=5286 RepID=A0A2S9ZWE8_RHOTO|nr:hypothetical protein AAT19DRAFT_11743 [Rhodotorula toruloides]
MVGLLCVVAHRCTLLCSYGPASLVLLDRSRRPTAIRIAVSLFLTSASLLISSNSAAATTRHGGVWHAVHNVESCGICLTDGWTAWTTRRDRRAAFDVGRLSCLLPGLSAPSLAASGSFPAHQNLVRHRRRLRTPQGCLLLFQRSQAT